jgi:hypothetical protein
LYLLPEQTEESEIIAFSRTCRQTNSPQKRDIPWLQQLQYSRLSEARARYNVTIFVTRMHMECTVRWTGLSGMTFLAETGSGHVVAMDGAPEGGGRNLGAAPDGSGTGSAPAAAPPTTSW